MNFSGDDQEVSSLTELEGAALGVVWRRGRCSAYAVMREFATSASSSWSASAGAVYPALRRLERVGLITGTDERGKRGLVITAAGTTALRQWLTIKPGIGGVTSDPVRTRLFFLDVLQSNAERDDLITAAEAETLKALKERETKLECSPSSDPERIASMGSIFELKGRLQWLRWARKEISG